MGTRPAAPPSCRDLVLLLLLSVLVFLPLLGQRDLWNPDEPRYAEVTREMLLSGSYLVPRLNGEIYSEKPPLLFWSMALASVVRGQLDEIAARLPAALSAIGSVLLVFWLGGQLFSYRAAWLAALAYATCRKILWQGQDGQIDMLLVFLVTAAVCCWLYGFRHRRPGFSYLFFFAAGLATLAKGPVGLLPPLFSIVVFLVVSGRRREIGTLRPGRGLLVWVATVLAWLIPAALVAGPEYLQIMIFKQNLTRFADPWHHFRPWYYYLTVIPGDFFPWAFFLPAAAVVGWRRFHPRGEPAATAERQGGETGISERDGFLFALCWAVVTLLFFSVSPAKRTVYILTMYPAMALLVGYTLDQLAEAWPRSRRWLLATAACIATIPILATVAVPVLADKKQELVAVLGDSLPGKVMVVMGMLALSAVLSWVMMLRGQVSRGVAVLAGGMAVWHLAILLLLVPHLEQLKSARPLAAILSEQMAQDEEYGIYPRLDAPFLFYTGRFAVDLRSEEELHAFCQRPGRVWLLAERSALRQLQQPPEMVEVAGDLDHREGYVLLRSPQEGEREQPAGAPKTSSPAPSPS